MCCLQDPTPSLHTRPVTLQERLPELQSEQGSLSGENLGVTEGGAGEMAAITASKQEKPRANNVAQSSTLGCFHLGEDSLVESLYSGNMTGQKERQEVGTREVKETREEYRPPRRSCSSGRSEERLTHLGLRTPAHWCLSQTQTGLWPMRNRASGNF